MAQIILNKFINAPVNIVFDLSRSVDLHQLSVAHTNEKAVAGVTQGLMELHDDVTWQARHLFKTRLFTSRITAMKKYDYFKDEMQQGDFKRFEHEHCFKEKGAGTLMTDKLELQSPFGMIGMCVDSLFMRRYIKQLLIKRNNFIKNYAESGAWQKILNDT